MTPEDLAHWRVALDEAEQVVFLGGQHRGILPASGHFIAFLSA
jgi:hypothetical protein